MRREQCRSGLESFEFFVLFFSCTHYYTYIHIRFNVNQSAKLLWGVKLGF